MGLGYRRIITKAQSGWRSFECGTALVRGAGRNGYVSMPSGSSASGVCPTRTRSISTCIRVLIDSICARERYVKQQQVAEWSRMAAGAVDDGSYAFARTVPENSKGRRAGLAKDCIGNATSLKLQEIHPPFACLF